MAAGASSHSRVDPTMSVSMKVTTPVGSSSADHSGGGVGMAVSLTLHPPASRRIRNVPASIYGYHAHFALESVLVRR